MNSKYMTAVETADETSKKAWEIKTKKDQSTLGWIYYFQRWKQYVFSPHTGTVFSSGCLQDIITFINQIGG